MKKSGNFFSKTLQRQILIPFLSLIIFAGAGIGIASYLFSVNITSEELEKSVEGQMEMLDSAFTNFYRTQENIVSYYSDLPELKVASNKLELIDMFDHIKDSGDAVMNAYLGTENGDMITNSGLTLPEGYDPRDRPWYIDSISEMDKIVWTQPYIDAESQELVVSVAKAVVWNDKPVGVFSLDLSMAAFISMVGDISIGQNGYVSIIDNLGNVIAHPNNEVVGTSVTEEEYYKKALARDQAISTLQDKLDGQDVTRIFVQNEVTDWMISAIVMNDELEDRAKPIFIPISISLLIVTLLAIVGSYFVAKMITKPIKNLQQNMNEVAVGNLTVTLIQNKQNEIGQLSKSAEEMKESLREIIKNVSNATSAVTSQSEELTQSANEVKDGSAQIASTMEEIAVGAESQANHSTQLSELMDTLARNITDAHKTGDHLLETSEQVLSMTQEGSSLMHESIKQMNTIDKIVSESMTKVQGLDDQTKEISKLIQVIKDIADQTNLLALNAAIEAARAGEHGKGFAVVAEEVRKLAEQVSHSVGDITGIVSRIQSESDSVVSSLSSGYDQVTQGSKQIGVTGGTFEKITHAMTDMVGSIEGIAKTLNGIATSSGQMNQNIQEIASISEETAAGVEQVAASSQQSSSSMEEVARTAEELSNLAERLNTQVKAFKV